MPSHYDQTLIQKLLTTVNDQGRQICELKQRLEQHREREKSQSEALAESAKAFNDIERWRSLLSEKQQELGKKAIWLDEREQRLRKDEHRLQFTAAVFNRATESAKAAELAKRTTKKTTTPTTALPSDQKIVKAKNINYIAFGPAKRQFNANPSHIDWSAFPSFEDATINMEDKRVKQLRHHDYYKGWLDCMRSFDTLQAWREDQIDWEGIQYLFDKTDVRSPINAERNVGLLYGWSAICTEVDMPQHDARLDDRVWNLQHLIPKSDHTAGSGREFWQGVKWGKDTIMGLFEIKAKSGIWTTKEDPEQVEYLKEVCRKDKDT